MYYWISFITKQIARALEKLKPFACELDPIIPPINVKKKKNRKL